MNPIKVFIIAYSFPPFEDAQAIRWYYLVNLLGELGVESDVLTVKHPRENDPLWRFHPNVHILRIYPGPIEAHSLNAKHRFGVDGAHNRRLRQTAKFRVMKSLYWFLRNFIGSILPGDIRTEWFPYAIQMISKNIQINKYGCIITSHEPWVDSLLGLYIKKRHPELVWIADFGDPYVAPYTPRHKLWLEKRLENLIYRDADALIFTNKNIFKYLKERYSFLKNKHAAVIEQGFSFSSCTKGIEKRKNNVFTLTYTGTFYKKVRDPSFLIEALTFLDFPFKFVVAGRNESFLKDFKILGERFEFLGLVDHFTALRLQRESDVLVHIGNTHSIQVPGKVFEYFGAMRPILSIISNPQDSTGELIVRLKRGLSCINEPHSIKDAINILHQQFLKGNVGFNLNCDHLYEYSWESKAKSMYEIIKSVT